jgi:integrase
VRRLGEKMGTAMASKMIRGTRHRGVTQVDHGRFRVVAKRVDPRTGKARWLDREIEAASADDAARIRLDLLAQLMTEAQPLDRLRVGDWAKRWLKSKALKIDVGTAERYKEALEHALDDLGDFWMDAVRATDVQAWIDAGLRAGRAPATVRGWFRVFRTMWRDAMEPLGLERDPTLRIQFPEEPEREEPNALDPAQLESFLVAMHALYPQHFALTTLLAWTGLRFCHASALRWEDVDEERGVIWIRRKQVRGRVGQVSRRKRAPRELPLEPALARAIREHRELLEESPTLCDSPWVFPSRRGTLRTPGGLWKAWQACLGVAEIAGRFTVHGLRRTFNDLARRSGTDAIITRAMTGHVTERMREHYSTVGLSEKRTAMANVIELSSARKLGKKLG